ncbi:MAG: hypothetical protein KQJ78_01380 [Deltaproteobacteria bacterium]|nr:hypothetical protein [Deltaproteobacteria bacterium]
MRSKLLLISGGVALASAVFHASFWVLFDWAGELPKLSPENAGIMQMLNIVCIYGFLFQGFASFVLARKPGPWSVAEKAILVFIGGFFLLRAAFGFPLFGWNLPEAMVVLVCLMVSGASFLALGASPRPRPAARAR